VEKINKRFISFTYKKWLDIFQASIYFGPDFVPGTIGALLAFT